MKNIAIIITKLNGGGAERCASNLSIELSKRYNVTLITFDGSNMTYPHGGELIDLKIPADGGIKKLINIIKRTKKTRAIKKEREIECSISLLDGPNLVNVLSSRGEKTIVSVRNMLSREPMSKFRKKTIKYASTHSDVTVSLSEVVKLDLINNFDISADKITTVYNHCDAKLLKSLCDENPSYADIKSDEVNFVTMGRLNKQKGQWHLIRAFKKVVREIPNAHLYIMGEGELKDKLETLIDELKLGEHITLTGYIKNPHGVYRDCEAFVFPSLFEGLGNVLLEALAFDMPIISCDCPAGPREILAPDTDITKEADDIEFAKYGILVPLCDNEHFNSAEPLTRAEECLADAMIYLHKNDDVRQEYANKASIRIGDFEKKKIMDDWGRIIDA